ncbi:MAG: SPOR domain-containing protein [Bacteroidales bacterium]|nr:SPOR domain-containing protein [Bacteroidales bacterium]
MKKLFAIIAAVAFVSTVYGQKRGTVTIDYNSVQLDSLISMSHKIDSEQSTLNGYRVQVYSGSGVKAKAEAKAAQIKLQTLYPNEKVYIVYNAPFWRVRIGDFRYRSEALPLLSDVKTQFAGSYTVRDHTVRKKIFK